MDWEKRTLILVLFLLVSISSVSAMRGSPAIVTITYDPAVGVDEDFKLNFVSTEAQPGLADISTLGEGVYERFAPMPDGTSAFNTSQIEEYVKFDKTVLDLAKEHTVNVHVVIPPNAPLAGPHEFGIISSERPRDPKGFLVITTAVIIKIRVEIPFPGQYLEITRFGVNNVNQGQNTNFVWQVKGRGLDATPFSAKLELFSKDGTSIYTRDLGNYAVNPLEVYPPAGTPDETLPTSSLTPGPYSGVLTVKFDDKVKTSISRFNVGEEAVSLDNYTPSTLVLGEINQVHLFVRNLWNGPFDNVRADINLNGTLTTTPTATLRPFETVEIIQFMDSRDLPEGNYTGTVKVYFGTKSNTFPVTFEVAKKVIPPPPEPERKTPAYLPYLIVGVILLLVLLALLIFKLRKKESGDAPDAASRNSGGPVTPKLQESKQELKPKDQKKQVKQNNRSK